MTKLFFDSPEQIHGDIAYNEKRYKQAFALYNKGLHKLEKIASKKQYKDHKFHDNVTYALACVISSRCFAFFEDEVINTVKINKFWQVLSDELERLVINWNVLITYQKNNIYTETSQAFIFDTYESVILFCEDISDIYADKNSYTNAIIWMERSIGFREEKSFAISIETHNGYLNLLYKRFLETKKEKYLEKMESHINKWHLNLINNSSLETLELLSHRLIVASILHRETAHELKVSFEKQMRFLLKKEPTLRKNPFIVELQNSLKQLSGKNKNFTNETQSISVRVSPASQDRSKLIRQTNVQKRLYSELTSEANFSPDNEREINSPNATPQRGTPLEESLPRKRTRLRHYSEFGSNLPDSEEEASPKSPAPMELEERLLSRPFSSAELSPHCNSEFPAIAKSLDYSRSSSESENHDDNFLALLLSELEESMENQLPSKASSVLGNKENTSGNGHSGFFNSSRTDDGTRVRRGNPLIIRPKATSQRLAVAKEGSPKATTQSMLSLGCKALPTNGLAANSPSNNKEKSIKQNELNRLKDKEAMSIVKPLRSCLKKSAQPKSLRWSGEIEQVREIPRFENNQTYQYEESTSVSSIDTDIPSIQAFFTTILSTINQKKEAYSFILKTLADYLNYKHKNWGKEFEITKFQQEEPIHHHLIAVNLYYAALKLNRQDPNIAHVLQEMVNDKQLHYYLGALERFNKGASMLTKIEEILDPKRNLPSFEPSVQFERAFSDCINELLVHIKKFTNIEAFMRSMLEYVAVRANSQPWGRGFKQQLCETYETTLETLSSLSTQAQAPAM